jgi:hypothetical protein
LRDLPSFPGCFVSELHYNDADEDVCVEIGKIFYRYHDGYVGLSVVAAYPLKNLLTSDLLQVVRVPHAHELNQELVTLPTQSFCEDISDIGCRYALISVVCCCSVGQAQGLCFIVREENNGH